MTFGPGIAEITPAWSPDGSQIAFVSQPETPRGHIAVIPAGGGPVTFLTTSPYTDLWPSWSPDGSQIAFERRLINGETDLWVVPASGGEPVRLTNDLARDSHPTWSPDGSMLAFNSDRGGTDEIWVLPAVPPISVQPARWGSIKAKYRE